MIGIAINLVVQVSAYASIMGLYLTVQPPGALRPEWHWIVIGAASTVFLISIAYDVTQQYSALPKRFVRIERINRYMHRWVAQGGRTVIFSRDMSWVDEETRSLLIEKARRNELIVCLEKAIELSEALKDAGATIVTYAELGHAPRSRFTIIDFERDGARVAVGQRIGRYQVIQEFQHGRHPLFAVAEDLVQILLGYSKIDHSKRSRR